MTTLVQSFLDGSSSFLKVTRTTIKARMGLKFSQIRPWIVELAALEGLKNHKLSCDHSSAFIFDWIFFILTGNMDNHKISDGLEIQPDQTLDCGVSCP